ncbi:MAG: hypothetical protein ACRC6I_16455 [Paracoccaceae bacterium]
MRGFIVALCLAAGPVAADTVMSEVSGNWAGADGGGFYFRAVLSQVEDRARLQIWNGTDEAALTGDAQFDNDRIALSAFATEQALEVLETETGSMLGLTIRFADETAEGQEVLMISFLDNQFTVMGFAHESTAQEGGAAYACALDLWNGTVTAGGVTSDLPPMDFEAKNASDWHFGAAFERGYCPPLE